MRTFIGVAGIFEALMKPFEAVGLRPENEDTGRIFA